VRSRPDPLDRARASLAILVRVLPARLAVILALASVGSAGCRRDFDEWHHDLVAGDAWHRRMAAHALRSAGEGDLARAFTALLLRLRDHDPLVAAAIEDALAALAPRSHELFEKALQRLPPERGHPRKVLQRLLLERVRDGDERAREVLSRFAHARRARR
jgi:hypothetical protein